MIRILHVSSGRVEKVKDLSTLTSPDGIIWVDLQSPTPEEQSRIEKLFSIEFQTQQEVSEIESSSRYFEGDGIIEANSIFIVYERNSFAPKQVSFILKDNVLLTRRNDDLKSFAETVRKIKSRVLVDLRGGAQIMVALFETRIDFDADFIESLSRNTTNISRKLLKERVHEEQLLLNITEYQENTMLIRESIVDKQRTVSAMIKSNIVADDMKDRLRIILRDITSLLQNSEFCFDRLEYLQNTFLGMVNLEQNQIIKIFTVASVVFMPPTLIASIYGMNFRVFPERDWTLGYPFALVLMILSSLFTLWFFRRKKWL